MEGRSRSSAQPPGAFTVEATRALRFLPPEPDPILLAYHPLARTNPFQALLYREAWAAGIASVPMVRIDTLDELVAMTRLGHRTLLHLHWLAGPLSRATTAADAERAGGAFLARLDDYRSAGGRIAWTIHNALPHEARFEAQEARFRAGVVERADVVHVLAKGTVDHVAPWFSVPVDHVLHVPHPSYIGAYEDSVSRLQARHELELGPDELVFLVTGAIRPYKGLGGLLDAWDTLPADTPRRLVIAGPPGEDPGVAELVERAALHPSVVLHGRRIPAGEMQLFLRAADIAVLPYVASLNSGALMLALSFGVPVIVPAGGGLAEAVGDAYARTFDPHDGAALRDALLRAPELATPVARAAARAAAEALDPVTLSRRFATELRARLDR